MNAYLADVDRQAKEMLNLIITPIAEREDVNEALNTKDQLKWVQMMNNIKASAEEVVIKNNLLK